MLCECFLGTSNSSSLRVWLVGILPTYQDHLHEYFYALMLIKGLLEPISLVCRYFLEDYFDTVCTQKSLH